MAASSHRASSLADVARLAGVSAQTVSRVINHPESVRPETAERVRAAMQEVGYRPNFAGRSLKEGRYNAVGLMTRDVTSTGSTKRLTGIMHAANAAGNAVTLMEAEFDDDTTLAGISRALGALPVDGAIISLSRMVKDFEEFVPQPGLRTVLLTPLVHPVCSTADNDHYRCSQTAVEHLLAKGHRRVHHICGVGESLASQCREAGWRETLQVHGIEVPEPIRGDWTADSGYEAGAILARDPSCTAIYASNDAMALGAIAALRDAGKDVPRDVSVIGVDDSYANILPRNPLTSVRFDEEGLGLWAFNKAVGRSVLGDEKEHLLLPGTLIERKTVAEAKR